LAGQTALQVLRDKGKMKVGDSILIFGGSGGVGSLAIQFAKALGAAKVTTTSSSVDLCKGLGADEVINYHNDDVLTKLGTDKFNVVFDTVGGIENWKIGQKVISKGGTYVSIVGDGVSLGKMIPRLIYRKYIAFWNCGYDIFFTEPNAGDLETIRGWVEEGKVKAVMDQVKPFPFTLDGAKDLFTKMMSCRNKGKITMTIKE
jgi:NADPH:quinone reductase-like Zn-dependent oxidoreductase